MKTANPHFLRGVLCALSGGVCWGISGTCGQYLFSRYGVSPVWLTCVRMLGAAPLLLLLALPRCRKTLAEFWRHPKDVGLLAVYGIFGLVMCQFAYMTAISYSNAATTTVLQNMNLVFTLLLTCLWRRRAPTRREGAALVLAAAGTFLLATGGDPRHMVLSGRGLFWGLTTAAAVTLYTLLPRDLLPRWGREVVTGYGMLFGGVLLNLAARSWRFQVRLPADGWAAVAAVVLVGTVMSFSLFMQSIADIGPILSSMLETTEPVTAALLAALWLKTRFTAADLAGFACILVMIFLLTEKAPVPASTSPQAPPVGTEAAADRSRGQP